MTNSTHQPVLVEEVLSFLPATASTFADLTLGEGGHAEAILRELGKDASLIGFDRDVTALEKATARLAVLPNPTEFYHDSYASLDTHLGAARCASIDFALADLGFSSLQLEGSGRGFSFTHPDEPLDLRFDVAAGEPLAVRLAHVAPAELTKVLAEFGELRQ
ncbi:MAG: 16S rRNA (cytosine(1402)-N(4))-methyltransferase, partial [bacterium]